MNDLQLNLTIWMNHTHNVEQNKPNTKEHILYGVRVSEGSFWGTGNVLFLDMAAG